MPLSRPGFRRSSTRSTIPTRWPPAGAARLADAGVDVASGVLADEVAGGPLREWLHKQRTGKPHVTWKFATSIDGRSAAADGSSQWITSEAARADVHRRRAVADAIVVGTGTVFVDDPTLTARLPDGTLAETTAAARGRREREISSEAKVLNDDSRTMVIRTRDPHEVIRALSDRTDVLVEGGPTLAGAFLRAGVIDRILAYVAPHPAGRTDHRRRRRRRAHHRARPALAIRRRRPDRAGSAAQSGARLTDGATPNRCDVKIAETRNSFATQCDCRHAQIGQRSVTRYRFETRRSPLGAGPDRRYR